MSQITRSARVAMCIVIEAAILSAAPAVAAPSGMRSIGDTRVFAVVPPPGQPAGIAVDGQSVLVSTLGLVTQPITDPQLFVLDRSTGAQRRSVTIPRMMVASAMQFDGVALDARGRAYVVDMNGRIVRIDTKTGAHEIYAEFPAAVAGLAAMPFDLTFDRTGVAYVTDQNLAAIWRVPPGGGSPEIWFQDPRLASYLLGPSGIRLDRSGRHLYFTVAASAAHGGQGLVYRLPVDDPSSGRLAEVFRYPPRSNPFGIAFGATGKLYVALYGAHQISVLRPDRTEELRFPSAEENARRKVPYDRPVAVAFDGRGSLLVTNSASFSSADRMVVLDAFVDDTGAPLFRPAMPVQHPADDPATTYRPSSSQQDRERGNPSVPAPEPTPGPRSGVDRRPPSTDGPRVTGLMARSVPTDDPQAAADHTAVRRRALAATSHDGSSPVPALFAALAIVVVSCLIAVSHTRHSRRYRRLSTAASAARPEGARK